MQPGDVRARGDDTVERSVRAPAARLLAGDLDQAPVLKPGEQLEIVPPSNIAVGTVPWGLSRWVRPGSAFRISTGQDDIAGRGGAEPIIGDVLAATAGGRPLLIVVRDAHRYPVAQATVRELLAARPAAVVVKMGLPIWCPPTDSYLATFGATRASSLAAAEQLGLAQNLTPR